MQLEANDFMFEMIESKKHAHTAGITGSSQLIQHIRDRVAEYSLVDEPVLLKGETGTGKNYIGELIHKFSGRPGKFKIINTPGISEHLFESEVFGHKKGSFTDATYDKEGLIHEAEGGTLFIDEITEVPASIQAKFLRFVETRIYTILGDARERTADIRIVAATNRNIREAIADKVFREDLYYRVNVLEIGLPPLRKRKEDIKDLVNENLAYLNGKEIGEGFWNALYNHQWPGNIRELITVLKRAGICNKHTIDGRDIEAIIDTCSLAKYRPGPDEDLDNIWDKIKSGRSFWEAVKAPFLDREIKRSEVKTIIERGLQETGGKYKNLLSLFNLGKNEYKNFMRFLYYNRLR